MNLINKLVIDSLSPINVSVSFQKYSGKAKEYITFHEYLSNGEEYEDDVETLTGHYIQVDVWTKGDYVDIVNKVKQLLIKQGFKRISEIDLYENDTGIYHKGIRFYYLEDREEIDNG